MTAPIGSDVGLSGWSDLLEERERYEGWLRALEGRRSTTPPHVFDRVHTDYSLRLDRVMHRLRERAAHLEDTSRELLTRLERHTTRERELTDARHEAELRAAVGELPESEWDAQRTKLDADLASVADERSRVETDLAEVRRIIAIATGQRVPGSQMAESDGGAEDRATVDDASASIAEFVSADPATSENPEATVRDASDEVAAAAAPQGDGAPRAPEVDRTADDAVSAPVWARGARSESATVGADRATAAASVGPLPGSGSATPAPSGSGESLPSASHDDGDTPRRDGEKTLRCPECGAMNYATEWYCERCGGELSTF